MRVRWAGRIKEDRYFYLTPSPLENRPQSAPLAPGPCSRRVVPGASLFAISCGPSPLGAGGVAAPLASEWRRPPRLASEARSPEPRAPLGALGSMTSGLSAPGSGRLAPRSARRSRPRSAGLVERRASALGVGEGGSASAPALPRPLVSWGRAPKGHRSPQDGAGSLRVGRCAGRGWRWVLGSAGFPPPVRLLAPCR